MCFFKPKITVPKVEAPAQAATPVSELPTPEPAVLGGSDQKNTDLGGKTAKSDKAGKSQLKIDLTPTDSSVPKAAKLTGVNRALNVKRG